MILNSTKYKNPQRIISGLINLVFNGDTILLCNTSLSAVNLTLLEIPYDQWNTTYKLYVVDNSNNAATNNITITAPTGFLINGATSLTISTNGGTCLVTISSNTSYIGILSNIGTGSNISILNQSILISPAATSMNFIGIQATAIGGAITINNNFISLTNAALNALISTNGLIPSQAYNITNAIFGNSTISHNVYVNATSVNSISILGSGKFFNADYNNLGNYSGVSGYVANLGVWTSTLIVVVGNVCIWNNLQYVNLTGVNNALLSPNADLVNWQFLSYSTTKGYIVTYDEITYNVGSNEIEYRKDIFNNEVEAYQVGIRSSLNDFAWGNQNVISNKVLQDSIFAICNTKIVIGINNNSIISALVYCFDSSNQLNWGICDSLNDNSISFNIRPLYFKLVAGSISSNNTFLETNGQIYNSLNLFSNTFITCDVQIQNANLFTNNSISNSAGVNLITTITGVFTYNVFNGMINLRANSSSDIISNVGQYSEFIINNTTAPVSYNEIYNNSKLQVTTLNSAGIYYNCIKNLSVMIFSTNTGIIGNGGVGKGYGNILTNGSIFNITTNSGQHYGNNIDNSEIIISTTCSGSIIQSNFSGTTSIKMLSYTGGVMSLLTLIDATFGNNTLNETKSFSGVYSAGNGNILIELDCTDATIYNLASKTLTIPPQYVNFGGAYTLKNSNLLQINKIINLSSLYDTTFRIASGTTAFITTAVGIVAGVGEMVSSYSPTPYTFNLVFRALGNDYIKMIKENSSLNEITQVGIFV